MAFGAKRSVMRTLDPARAWLPVLATGLGFVVVVGGAALLASATLADLIGLVYLLASPAIYRGLVAVVDWESRASGRVAGTAN